MNIEIIEHQHKQFFGYFQSHEIFEIFARGENVKLALTNLIT